MYRVLEKPGIQQDLIFDRVGSCVCVWVTFILGCTAVMDYSMVHLQGFFGKECANEAVALEYNRPVIKAESSIEYDYYALPAVADSELHNTVEVKVQASFSSSSGYSDWVSARPELLLIKVSTTLKNNHHFV